MEQANKLGIGTIAIGYGAGYNATTLNGICISSTGAVETLNSNAGSILIKSATAYLLSTGTANWVHSGTMTTASDRRLKKDIAPITDALAKVQALNGVNFKYIEGEVQSTGLIAQDVQAVLPDAVSEIDDEGHLGLAYGNMVGLLVEAIKELSEKLTTLENNE